jgi:MinD superfamily P-loop ATPase
VASGKGGTGKTTVAVNLARIAGKCLLTDCDVEAPDVRVFLQCEALTTEDVSRRVPRVDAEQCTLCRRCTEACEFGALVAFPGHIQVADEMCHNCGLCYDVCSEDALTPQRRPVGTIRVGHSNGILVRDGELNIGEPRPGPVIAALLETPPPGKRGVEIRDCPPGTGCSVVESLRGVRFAVLVTEPTPLGLHDLDLALRLTERMGIERGVVINRSGPGAGEVRRTCERDGVEILAEFPFDPEAASAIARGDLLVDSFPEWKRRYRELWRNIEKNTGRARGSASAS